MGNNGNRVHDAGDMDFACFQPMGRNEEILDDLEVLHHMPGWRLCMGHLAPSEEFHEGAVDLAIRSTVAEVRRRFRARPMDEDPAVLAVREVLDESGEHATRWVPTSERLASRILQGEPLSRDDHLALIFRNLLSLRTMLPWSVVDAANVEFPMTFRPGEVGEMGADRDGQIDVRQLPVIVDARGEVHCCPCACPGDTNLSEDTTQIIVFCYTPLSHAHAHSARKTLSKLVSMTWAYRFVEARAYRPVGRPQ